MIFDDQIWVFFQAMRFPIYNKIKWFTPGQILTALVSETEKVWRPWSLPSAGAGDKICNIEASL